jgi:hypothetical protein
MKVELLCLDTMMWGVLLRPAATTTTTRIIIRRRSVAITSH